MAFLASMHPIGAVILIFSIGTVIAMICYGVHRMNEHDKATASVSQNSGYFRKSHPGCTVLYGWKEESVVLIDNEDKKWSVSLGRNGGRTVSRRFCDVMGVEILRNGRSVTSSKSGSAAAGSVLLGVVGGLIGASGQREIEEKCTSISVRVSLREVSQSVINIPVYEGDGVYTTSKWYREYEETARKIANAFLLMIESQKEESAKESRQENVSAEIEKLFAQKERGIITEEEFAALKEKLISR